jgi:hypothetical protein
MLSQQEFNALVLILNRAPMTSAEALGMQVIVSKLVPREKKPEEEKPKEEKEEKSNGL